MPKTKLTARTKLFAVIIAFVVFAGFMFTYGYGIMEAQNRTQLDTINQKKLELLILEREQENFTQGKKDIAELQSKEYPPQELFSKDTKVVKEIKKLEELASRYSLEMSLSVTGSVETAEEATEVTSELLIVPYTLQLEGAYQNLQKFLQAAEHTAFINHVTQINVEAEETGMVRANLFSRFYLQPL